MYLVWGPSTQKVFLRNFSLLEFFAVLLRSKRSADRNVWWGIVVSFMWLCVLKGVWATVWTGMRRRIFRTFSETAAAWHCIAHPLTHPPRRPQLHCSPTQPQDRITRWLKCVCVTATDTCSLKCVCVTEDNTEWLVLLLPYNFYVTVA